jgi:hypothetical protein
MLHRLTTVTLLTMALCSANARAHEPDAPVFSFRGFGTLGVVYSSEDKADFVSSVFKPNGAGYTRDLNADIDSLIAAQVTANISPQLSAILQIISEQNYDDTYRPHVEWANVKYQFTPEFSLRVGRIVQSSFLVSEYRKVGYAYPWARPPLEVYNLVPITNSDGVDASYRLHIGGLTNTLQGAYGKTEPDIPAGGTVEAKDLWNLSYTGEYGAATVHIAYLEADLTVEVSKPLFDGFRQFGPEGVALAEKYDVNNTPISFIGLGAMYDPGDWFVMGEWGSLDSHSVLGERSAWYASGGYRLGSFTPYLTYAQAELDSNSSDPGLTLSALPPPLAGPATILNAGLNTNLKLAPVQKTVSVGGRWDVAKNAALKLQFDHIRFGTDSHGTLINIQSGFQPGGEVNVISATLDFVF